MSFSPQFLDELRSRLSLAQTVGRRVKLTRRGRDYVGLCPFHKEKTPSFNVVEDKGFYHCFGCGAHGDVIGFTMRAENAGFREAVEDLAKQAGLTLPQETPQEREQAARVATLHDVCAAAAGLFEEQLWSPSGAAALAYLRDRGLSDELIRRFRLGWAPDSSQFLRGALGPQFPEPLLLEAGLLRYGERGAFDFFRGRVIFPIADRSGRIVAFGGRVLGDGQPKYLNSPDTPIFHKGRALYAYHAARAAAAPENPPIVTEGYMDVIALHGAGFATAVAPLGTALTEEQIAELWRLAPEPIVCFDGDAAGRRAAERALDRALPQLLPGKSLKFVSLPGKHDPDSLIRESGPEAMRSLLAGSQSLSEFLWHSSTEDKVFPTVESLAELQDRLTKRVQHVADRTLQFHLKRFVSDQVWELSRRLGRKRRLTPEKQSAQDGLKLHALLSDEKSVWNLHALLLGAVINHPAIAAGDIDRFVMLRHSDPMLSRLAQAIVAAIEEKHEIDAFDLRDRLEAIGFAEAIDRICRSDLFRASRFVHAEADPYDAALSWRAVFSRTSLPELKAELEASLAAFEAEPDELAWERVERLRRLVEEQNSEAELVPQQRDPTERWQPRRAA